MTKQELQGMFDRLIKERQHLFLTYQFTALIQYIYHNGYKVEGKVII